MYSYVQVRRELVCKHPCVAAIWETGSISEHGEKSSIHIHVITFGNQRFEATYEHGESETAAFSQIDEWLDKTYPNIAQILKEQ